MDVAFYEGVGEGGTSPQLGGLRTSKNGQEAKGGIISNVRGAPQVINYRFPYQSYFGDKYERGVLLQPTAEGLIVPSTLRKVASPGYAIGLTPMSQTPVAIRLAIGGAGNGGAREYILKPGQILRPFGRDRFTGFEWGLPFGWLGGGVASLVIYQDPEAAVDWGGGAHSPELVFHRQRTVVYPSNTDLEAGTALARLASGNWPTVFPWAHNQREDEDDVVYRQQGVPVLAVEPTRVFARFLVDNGTIADAVTLQMVFKGLTEFDAAENDTISANFSVFEFTVPARTPPDAAGAERWPVIELPAEIARLGTNRGTCGMVICTAPYAGNPATLNGFDVDLIRYGRL